jgi:hypothetical protein
MEMKYKFITCTYIKKLTIFCSGKHEIVKSLTEIKGKNTVFFFKYEPLKLKS